MGGVAQFMYVSARRFREDWQDTFGCTDIPALPPLPT